MATTDKGTCSEQRRYLITGLRSHSQNGEGEPTDSQIIAQSAILWWGVDGSNPPEEDKQPVEIFIFGNQVKALFFDGKKVEDVEVAKFNVTRHNTQPGYPFRVEYTKVPHETITADNPAGRAIEASKLAKVVVTHQYDLTFDPDEFLKKRHPNDLRPTIKDDSEEE